MQDSQHLLPSSGSGHEIISSRSLTLRPHQYGEPWKSGLSKSSQFVQLDSTVKKPVLIDVQGLPIIFWMQWLFEDHFPLVIVVIITNHLIKGCPKIYEMKLINRALCCCSSYFLVVACKKKMFGGPLFPLDIEGRLISSKRNNEKNFFLRTV
jgi:hypothetical protein